MGDAGHKYLIRISAGMETGISPLTGRWDSKIFDHTIRIFWIQISQINMKISVEMATLAVNHSHGDGIPKYLISRSEYLGSENLRSEYLGSEYLRSGGNTGSQPLSERWDS